MVRMDIEQVKAVFELINGQFITDVRSLSRKVSQIKALILDWDGVFNDGAKSHETSSPFHEPDALGLNLVRYALFLILRSHPKMIILSGARNNTATAFAKREHFDAVYTNMKFKGDALQAIMENYALQRNEVAYLFDDVNDLAVARQVGLNFMVYATDRPLFKEVVIREKLADYISGHQGGNGGLREICELICGLLGNFPHVLEGRTTQNESYRSFQFQKKDMSTRIIESEG